MNILLKTIYEYQKREKIKIISIISAIVILWILMIFISDAIFTISVAENELEQLAQRISLSIGATDDMIVDFKTNLSKKSNTSIGDIQVIHLEPYYPSDSGTPISIKVSINNIY